MIGIGWRSGNSFQLQRHLERVPSLITRCISCFFLLSILLFFANLNPVFASTSFLLQGVEDKKDAAQVQEKSAREATEKEATEKEAVKKEVADKDAIRAAVVDVEAVKERMFELIDDAREIELTPEVTAPNDDDPNSTPPEDQDPFDIAIQQTELDFKQRISAEEFIKMVARNVYDKDEVQKQLDLLGNSDYQKREMATKRLLIYPFWPERLQEAVKNHPSAEVRWRLKMVLSDRKTRTERLLVAAVQSVQAKKVPGLLKDLEALMSRKEDNSLAMALPIAYEEMGTAQDRDHLVAGLKNTDASVRLLNARTIIKVFGKDSVEMVEVLLDDADDYVRCSVAGKLINFGHRPTLATLANLLDSNDQNAKRQSVRILAAATGQDFGRLPFSGDKEIQAIKSKWMAWTNENAQNCKLNLPIEDFLKTLSPLNGNTLIVNSGEVTEYSIDRKVILTFPAVGADQVEKTFEGNYLIHSYGKKWVREVDSKGKILWEITGKSFNNAMPLANGNVLVTVGNKNLVSEYDKKTKKVVWEHKLESWTNDAIRMENGSTLVGYHGGVKEISPDKKVLWSFPKTKGTITICRPLPSGNILIGWTEGTVKEVNRAKKVVWEYACGEGLNDVFRDENGHTLIYSKSKFVELDTAKKVIWKVDMKSSTGSIRR